MASARRPASAFRSLVARWLLIDGAVPLSAGDRNCLHAGELIHPSDGCIRIAGAWWDHQSCADACNTKACQRHTEPAPKPLLRRDKTELGMEIRGCRHEDTPSRLIPVPCCQKLLQFYGLVELVATARSHGSRLQVGREGNCLERKVAQPIGITFACARVRDDFSRDLVRGQIGTFINANRHCSHFKCDAHDPNEFGIKLLTIEVWPDRHWSAYRQRALPAKAIFHEMVLGAMGHSPLVSRSVHVGFPGERSCCTGRFS
jgi:hypothetical protein